MELQAISSFSWPCEDRHAMDCLPHGVNITIWYEQLALQRPDLHLDDFPVSFGCERNCSRHTDSTRVLGYHALSKDGRPREAASRHAACSLVSQPCSQPRSHIVCPLPSVPTAHTAHTASNVLKPASRGNAPWTPWSSSACSSSRAAPVPPSSPRPRIDSSPRARPELASSSPRARLDISPRSPRDRLELASSSPRAPQAPCAVPPHPSAVPSPSLLKCPHQASSSASSSAYSSAKADSFIASLAFPASIAASDA